MNRCREMTVTYTFGEQSEVLDPATICSWITGSAEGQIQLNMDQVNAYVQTLASKYDTAGTARTFHTATGRDVSVTGPFGWKIDQAGAGNLSMLPGQWTAVRQSGAVPMWRQILPRSMSI